MKGAADKETNLYLRKDEESGTDNEWDDSKLIKAYDKAVNKAKQQIMKKLQLEMGLTDEEVKEVLSDSASSSTKKDKKKKKKKGKDKKKIDSDEKDYDWDVGDPCRAVYSEDGEEYEANILKIFNGNSCIVKFVGYGNEEEVLLKDLIPSLGKNVVQLQRETAQQENEIEEDEEESDQANGPLPNGEVSDFEDMADAPDPRLFFQRIPMFRNKDIPPPPPPMFGSASFHKFFSSANGPINQALSRDEAHNAMMFSWYMCGYYTGYYQRELKDA